MAKNNKQAANQDGNSTKKATKKKKKVKVSHIVKPENMTLEEWQIKLRKQVTDIEHFDICCVDDALCPGEYIVRNPEKNNEYKVVYRGANSEWNYCSCMDFKTSRLGTCKHIEAVKKWFGGKRGVHVHRELPPYTSVYLSYRDERCVKIRIGSDNKEAYEQLAKDYFDKNHVLKKSAYARIGSFLKQARQISDTFRCYKDAIDFIIDIREKAKRMKIVKTYDDEKLNNLLKVNLYPYQKEGIRFAAKAGKAIIADEMGLGKTIQAIATMVSLRNTGATHFVVVCPASVLTNWCREIRKMSRLSVTKVHGADRAEALQSWIKTGGVAVTTYETTGFFKLDAGFKFSLLVVDEAHYVKNPEAQRTKNVTNLSDHTERLLFMTGTALENKVDEMISLIKILQPTVASSVRGMEFLSSAPEFRSKVAPVYYRRKREDVLKELPDLIENMEWCTMTSVEEAVYEDAVLNKGFAAARRVSWNVDDLKDSSKAMRMKEIIEEAEDDGRKVIVFSFFLDTIKKITEMLGKRCYGPINGSVTPQRRQDIIDDFDKAPAGSVLAAQIQAGGTGLNIQSASVVILCEPQFKPSTENQAISRAYRMGQTRNVIVYRLLCEDTVDERITALLESKQEIFDAFADKSEAANESRELDEKDFGNIIKEEIDRINAKRGNPNGKKAE